MLNRDESLLDKIAFGSNKIMGVILFGTNLIYFCLSVLIFEPYIKKILPWREQWFYELVVYSLLIIGAIIVSLTIGIIGKIVFRNLIAVCPFCGEKNRGDRVLCNNCGEKLRF